MNHPNSEEWALYVSDEMPPERRGELTAHLYKCAVCAAELAALQRSVRRLVAWQFPARTFAKPAWAAPAIKWGLAATLVLGLGFAFGRFSSPTATLRAELERSVRASLAADVRDVLEAAQAQSKDAADEQMTHVVRQVVAAVNSVREEDRAATRALLEEVRQQHAQELRRVRLDLETVATQADDRLRLAHFQLRQLTANPKTP